VIGTTLDNADELDALTKLPEDKQRDLIERAKAGESVRVKLELARARRAEREQGLAASTEAASKALGEKLYGVLYVDPPWSNGDHPPHNDLTRGCERHYPTMQLADLKALKVPAANDCALFMWATVPLLPEALELMTSWGFEYKTAVTWVKDRIGIGYWARGQCEHLLVGVRGEVPSPVLGGDQLPAVIGAPRLKHSEKPPEFATTIERLFPTVPKLEMFARKARPGWDVWGNEAPMSEAAP
jgi:N6-adenosine-specific RNA methylase IME4